MHGLTAAWLSRGGQRRLPIARIDGRIVADSTAIIAALEEYKPEPALYPADPVDRARALELEEFFDEEVAPKIRRFVWHHTIGDIEAVSAALFTRPAPMRERLLRMGAPLMRPAMRRDFTLTDEAAEAARRAIVAGMDRLESELQPSGYLVGDRFSVADLTAASLFTPVLAPAGREFQPPTLVAPALELRAELEARPGGQWVHDMFARHRGESAEIGARPEVLAAGV